MRASTELINRAIARTEQRIRILNMAPDVRPIDLRRETRILEKLKVKK